MTLHIYYDDPDNGIIEITDHIKYGIGQIKLQSKAEQGTVATSTLTVEDPDGIFDFRGLRSIYIDEDAADFARLWTGWVWGKTYERGQYYRTGAARQITLEIQDINHILWQRAEAGSDTARPAETDEERMAWLLGTSEAALIDDVTTYVFGTSPVSMDANPSPGYNGQTFQNVVDDLAQSSGKNYFMLDVFDGYDYISGIWYGLDGLDEFVSDATISNVLSEVDNVTVFWADVGASLSKEPSRVFSGIFGNFDGGWTFQQLATTIADFAQRDTIASWPNIKSHAKAVARGQAQLQRLHTEEEAVTCTIYSMLPSQANVFRAGMRVNGVKFTHFPGWETGRDCRIVTKTITDQSEGLYSVELELLPLAGIASCTTQVASMASSQSGPFTGVVSTASWAVSAPSLYPCVVLTGFMGGSGFTTTGTISESDSDYTNMYEWDTNPIDYPTQAMAGGYKALTSGAPGTFSIAVDRVDGWAFVSCTLQTAATTPIQTAAQETSGDDVTFGAPVTAGNILIMFRQSTLFGAGPDDAPALSGWTLVKRVDNGGAGYPSGGGQVLSVAIWARCATSTDGTIIVVGDQTYAHWSYVSEWAIT